MDWSLLYCCRVVDLSVDSGPSAEPTRHQKSRPHLLLDQCLMMLRVQPCHCLLISPPTFFLESRCLILATNSPDASPLPNSALELDIAEGSPKAGSHRDKGALGPPSVDYGVQTNTMAILDQPPTLPSATDLTTFTTGIRCRACRRFSSSHFT
jgi:hypothetical protein